MKFGGKAFFCFTVSGLLQRDEEHGETFKDPPALVPAPLMLCKMKQDVSAKMSH